MTATADHLDAPCAPARDSLSRIRAVEAWKRWVEQPSPSARPANRGRVLLISYHFPPTGGSGVQRPAKLAKYLPECGWTVEILTAAHQRFPWTDVSLLSDLPNDLAVHRVAGREPACLARWLAAPCTLLGGEAWSRRVDDALFWRLTGWADRLGMDGGEPLWVGPAVRAAIRMHRETPFDAVISTGPPHFVHLAAMRVAQSTGLAWVADLRDPPVSDFDRSAASDRRIRRMRNLEESILERADTIVTTCPSFAWDLCDRYPDRAHSIHAITNGFDRDDLTRAIDARQVRSEEGECVFVAAGAFYGRRELARIIRPLERIMRLQPQWQGRVRLVVAGTIDAEQRRAWNDQHYPDWVLLAGYLSHDEALRLTASATCNIIIVPACEHGRLSIPGKTFELLALPAHILALVPPGSDTEHILLRAGGCTVAPFESEHAISAALQAIIESRLTVASTLDRNWLRVDSFDRRVVARRFADCLDSLCFPSRTIPEQATRRFDTAAEVA